MTAPKVGVFSFADIDNYGDILFSWVVRNELGKRCPDLVTDFYTPSDCWVEGQFYKGYSRSRVEGQYDVLILAGGEVVHFFDQRTWEPIYQRRGLSVRSDRASDVVWDWASCAAGFKAWLSVGVRPFGESWDPSRIATTLGNLDYISTRGLLSKKILEGGEWESVDSRIRVTPDLGWLFPRLARDTEADISPFARQLVDGGNYAVFQFHNITREEASGVAQHLEHFKAETGLDIVLLPVIHLWNDRQPLQWIMEASGEKFVMPEEKQGAFDIANIVAGSELAISSSLHVAITALAAGKPAAVFNKWPGTKFQDLMGLQMRSHFFITQIHKIDIALRELMEEKDHPQQLAEYSSFMMGALDRVFDMLAVRLCA